jgi:hypothetical protein
VNAIMVTQVPEPGSASLVAIGLATLLMKKRRRCRSLV